MRLWLCMFLGALAAQTAVAQTTDRTGFTYTYSRKCYEKAPTSTSPFDAKGLQLTKGSPTTPTNAGGLAAGYSSCKQRCTDDPRCALFSFYRKVIGAAQGDSSDVSTLDYTCTLWTAAADYTNQLTAQHSQMTWEDYSGHDLGTFCTDENVVCNTKFANSDKNGGTGNQECAASNSEGTWLKYVQTPRDVHMSPQCGQPGTQLELQPSCMKPESHVDVKPWTWVAARAAVENKDINSQQCRLFQAKHLTFNACPATLAAQGYKIETTHLAANVQESSVPDYCKQMYFGICFKDFDQILEAGNSASSCCEFYRSTVSGYDATEKANFESGITTGCAAYFTPAILTELKGGPRCKIAASTTPEVVAAMSPATHVSSPMHTVAAAAVFTYLLSSVAGVDV